MRTLTGEFGRRAGWPWVAGALGGFVLLPKGGAGDPDNYASSYWVQQYRKDLLPEVEEHGAAADHGSELSEEAKVMSETLERIKRIEANLGIED